MGTTTDRLMSINLSPNLNPGGKHLKSDNYQLENVELRIKSRNSLDILSPVRVWLDSLEIHSPKLAHFLCRLIPAQCPFERDIILFEHNILHIPPLCKLNPLYEETVGLRFRALCYLADECGVDVTRYCS